MSYRGTVLILMLSLSPVARGEQAALKPPPAGVADEKGQPRFGTYAGGMTVVEYGHLKAPYKEHWYDKLVHIKKWAFTSVYATTAEGKHFVVVDFIGDLGYGSSGFLAAYDLDAKKKIAGKNFTALPKQGVVSSHPAEGLDAHFKTIGAQFSLVRPRGAQDYQHRASLAAGGGAPAIELDVVLHAADATPLTMIAPIGEHAVTMTQKSQAMSGRGTLKIGKATYNLTEVHGAIDYTFGELKHHTKWRWASVTGFLSDKRRFGLNISEGLIETNPSPSENALWIGKEVIPLPKMTFEFDAKDTMRPWHVRSADPKERYSVDINLAVISKHENHTNLGVIRADYEQPVGYWRGSVVDNKTGKKYQFDNAVGLAENQDTKW